MDKQVRSAERPTRQEIIDIEFMIKKIIAESDISINKCVQLLNERFDSSDTSQTVVRQLKQGNMPFWKVMRIAETLGYKIKIEQK